VNRRVFLHPRVALVAATMSAAVVSGIVTAQQAPPQQPNFDAINVRSFKVQDNVYMLAGAGGNVTVQTGNAGVLVVDTQFAQMADKLLAEIARLSGNRPIRYVIDTHVHSDHVGGNERFRRAGRAIVAGNVAGDVRGNGGATVIAHETVAARMSQQDGTTPPAPGGAIPTDTFFGESDEVFFNGEEEVRRHGDLVSVRQHEVRTTAELLDETEDVIPSAAVEPDDVVLELVQDLFHLEGREDRLDQHSHLDRLRRDAELRLRVLENVGPEPRFEVAL
jgi:hypothetical protein